MGQTGPIELNPHNRTVRFAGRYINMSAIARAQGVHHASISNIFLGYQNPSLKMVQKICAVIGMGIDEFLQALEVHVAELKKQRAAVVRGYHERIAKEDAHDISLARSGKAVPPRLPATRIA